MKLEDIFLFQNLDKEELKSLEAITTIKKFKKDEIIFYEGENSKYLTILLDGFVKVYKCNKLGAEIIIHKFEPVSLIAEMALFEGINYPANCASLLDSTICFIDFEKFKSQFLTNPKVSLAIISSLTKKIKNLEETIKVNIIYDATQRVARFLYSHDDILNTQKHVEIAKNLNLTPETFSRVLRKFKDANVLKTEDNLQLLDKSKLKEIFLDD